MPVRLLRPQFGQAANTLYWASEDVYNSLRGTGNADDYIEGASDYAPLTRIVTGAAAATSRNATTYRMNAATAQVLTLNPSGYWEVGSILTILQQGAGSVTVTPASGVTINGSANSVVVAAQNTDARLLKTGPDTWTSLEGFVDNVASSVVTGAMLSFSSASKTRPISWQGRPAFSYSDGTNTWSNSQVQYPVLAPASSFVVKFGNFVRDAVPAATGDLSPTIAMNTIQVRAAAVKLFAQGTVSSPTTTGISLSVGYAYVNLAGKVVVVTNGTNGQQSATIKSSTGNSITVASWPGGTPTAGSSYRIYDFYPVLFNGSRTLSLDPGGIINSDPVPCSVIAGDAVWIITNVSASGIWPAGVMPNDFSLVDMWTNTGTGTNQDATSGNSANAWSSTASAQAYAPLGIFAQVPSGNKPSLGFLGDSIIDGTGPQNSGIYGHNLGQRVLVSVALPGWTGGIPGETTSGVTNYNHSRLRVSTVSLCQYVVVETGVNDNNDSNTTPLSVTQAAYLSIWAQLAANGAKVIQRVPGCFGTTSTDGFTTTTGQTQGPNVPARQALKAWLIDTGPTGAMAQAAGTLWKVWVPGQETAVGSDIWVPAVSTGASLTVASTLSGAILVNGTPFASGVLADVAANPDKYQVMIKSGTGTFVTGISLSKVNAGISNINGGNRINLGDTLNVAPTAGDTVQIYTMPVKDGTHPLRAAIEAADIVTFKANIFPFMQAVV